MKKRNKKKVYPKRDVYQEITNTIIASLEAGTIPWHQPWVVCGDRGLPRSGATGKPYSGINTLLTQFAPYESPWWLTFKQCKELGGNVKGQKGTMITKWIVFDQGDDDEVVKKSDGGKHYAKRPILKHFVVFNLEQCNLPDEALEKFAKRLDKLAPPRTPSAGEQHRCKDNADKVSGDYLHRENINLSHKGNQAFYAPLEDRIQMPERDQFVDSNFYYATLFHEEVHSTGHSSRLDRGNDTRSRSGSDEVQVYSREELVAEIGSAFICGMLGIANTNTNTNRDSYIAGWLKKLKDDKKAIILASSAATKAADYVLNKTPCEGDIKIESGDAAEGTANG
jgi:antirestriction protein ArdC